MNQLSSYQMNQPHHLLIEIAIKQVGRNFTSRPEINWIAMSKKRIFIFGNRCWEKAHKQDVVAVPTSSWWKSCEKNISLRKGFCKKGQTQNMSKQKPFKQYQLQSNQKCKTTLPTWFLYFGLLRGNLIGGLQRSSRKRRKTCTIGTWLLTDSYFWCSVRHWLRMFFLLVKSNKASDEKLTFLLTSTPQNLEETGGKNCASSLAWMNAFAGNGPKTFCLARLHFCQAFPV